MTESGAAVTWGLSGEWRLTGKGHGGSSGGDGSVFCLCMHVQNVLAIGAVTGCKPYLNKVCLKNRVCVSWPWDLDHRISAGKGTLNSLTSLLLFNRETKGPERLRFAHPYSIS